MIVSNLLTNKLNTTRPFVYFLGWSIEIIFFGTSSVSTKTFTGQAFLTWFLASFNSCKNTLANDWSVFCSKLIP